MMAWERATDTVGTTAGNELAPRWMQSLPDWEHPAPAALRAGNRPPGWMCRAAQRRADPRCRLRVDVGRGDDHDARSVPRALVRALLPRLARRNRRRAGRAGPEAATGWLAFDVPAGTHTVKVTFGETPWRLAADALSVLALVSLGVVLGRSGALHEEKSATSDFQKPPARWPIHLVWVSLALMSLKFLAADRYPVLWRATRWQAGGTLRGVAPPRNVNFGEQAILLGIEPLPATVAGDAAPTLTLYWRAVAPEAREWRVGVQLVGADGFAWAVGMRPVRWGREPPPLADWPRDRYARMDYVLDLPAGLPPGTYEMRLSLFDA